jgi:cytochrome P450
MSYTEPKSGKTYIFPKGTVMSMSMRDLHYNADIFPDPLTFSPERWLTDDSDPFKRMQQAFVPFSRGTRNCIGQELAKQELLLTAGNLVQRFDFELYESSERDVKLAHDWFAPFAELDSEGLRVKVH